MKKQIIFAFQDLITSFKRHKLWLHLGWTDIKLRYRGSILGPLWITLSMSIFIAAIGLIYSRLLNESFVTYIPYLTSGLLIWSYISTVLIDSNEIFHVSKQFISHISLPYMVFLYRAVWRNIIIFCHNLVVYLGVMLYFHVPLTWSSLLFIPGFALLTFTLTFVGLLISLIGTRYRDIPPVINSTVQIAFFVSPIAWMEKTLVVNSFLVRFNPVTYFLDIVRSPLLGQTPHETSWVICLALATVSALIVTPFFAINRMRIPFWL